MAFWCALIHLEVFPLPLAVSYNIASSLHITGFFPQSSNTSPFIALSSNSSSTNQVPIKWIPHALETYQASNNYEAFWKDVLLPLIWGSHDHQYIYYTNKSTLPLLVSFATPWPFIELVHKLILETDVNSPNQAPFPHYINYPPCKPAFIPIPPHHITQSQLFLDALYQMTKGHIKRVIMWP